MGTRQNDRDITSLLARCRAGDDGARDELAERIYPQLKGLARLRLSSGMRDQALQTTELVHETYVRLLGQRQVEWHDRAHFFAIAARLMRRALLDAARTRVRAKRGGGLPPRSLDGVVLAVEGLDVEALALDQAMQRLQAVDPRAARVVELRYFSGMSLEEVAEAMGIGRATASRAWRFARSWLHLNLKPRDLVEQRAR